MLGALRAVAAGRADYYVGSLLEASALLAREPVPGVEAQRLFGYNTGHYHFGIRKDWAQLAEILDKGTYTLRARPNAELLALLGKLPAYLKVPAPLPLDRAEAALLSRRPLWRVGAVQGLALLNDIDASGLHGGIAAEYTAQVMQRLGVAMQVVAFENVAAMLQGLRDGRIDVVPFLTRTPEREREFAFSIPYVEMPYLLVARSNGPLYWDLASLRGKRVALAHAHPLREVLAQRHPDIRIVDAPNGNVAMDRVARGEAEAAVEVKLFANLRINSDTAQALRAVAAVGELPAQFHFATARARRAAAAAGQPRAGRHRTRRARTHAAPLGRHRPRSAVPVAPPPAAAAGHRRGAAHAGGGDELVDAPPGAPKCRRGAARNSCSATSPRPCRASPIATCSTPTARCAVAITRRA